MKPIELIPTLDEELKGYIGCSSEMKALNSYKDNESIIAYTRNGIGTIFVIKTAKGFMGFILSNYKIRGYSLFRTSLYDIYKILCSEKERLQIINPELWGRFQNKIALMELNTDEKATDYQGVVVWKQN